MYPSSQLTATKSVFCRCLITSCTTLSPQVLLSIHHIANELVLAWEATWKIAGFAPDDARISLFFSWLRMAMPDGLVVGTPAPLTRLHRLLNREPVVLLKTAIELFDPVHRRRARVDRYPMTRTVQVCCSALVVRRGLCLDVVGTGRSGRARSG